MARLPTPGGDDDAWGTILNDYLGQAHNGDGSLKTSALQSALPDASATNKGTVQLTGDLGGTASSPSVTGLRGRTVSGTAPANNQILTYNSGSSQWEPQTSAGGYTDEMAQDAMGAMVADTATVNLTYNDLTPEFTADVQDNSITYGKLQDISATDRLLGRDSVGSGNTEELSVSGGLEFTGSGGIQRSALTGDVVASAGSGTTTIQNDAVTFAKIQNITSARILGRTTAGSGDAEELSAGTGISISGGQISTSITAYTDEMAQDAVGAALADTSTIDLTYDDATPAITASVIDDSVTYVKIQNISATDRLLGRATAGAGDIEEITLTAAGRALIDDADAAAQRTTLGLVIGTNVQAFDADLSALAGIGSNGILVHTGAGTAAARTIVGTANRVTVADGDGTTANPTLDIGTDVVTLNGTQTLTNKTISGASNTITNIDHGGLGGLADDDHTQYALLAGRASGQVLKGGTADTEHLDLYANTAVFADAAAGKVRFFNKLDILPSGFTYTTSGSSLINISGAVSAAGQAEVVFAGLDYTSNISYDTGQVAKVAYGIRDTHTMTHTAGVADSFSGQFGFLGGNNFRFNHSGSSSIGSLFAFAAQPTVARTGGAGSATIGDMGGLSTAFSGATTDIGANTTVTNYHHIWIHPVTSSGTVTTQVGVDIAALTTTTTSNIGVRIATPSGATTNYALQLSGTGGTAASGITFGTDANLYRSAASTLRTDGSLIVSNTGLKILDSDSTHTLNFTTSSNLTANRTLTFITSDASRTINLGGNLVIAANFTTSGSFGMTLTATGVTSVTLPTAGTLATLAGTETFTGKTLTSPTLGSTITLSDAANFTAGTTTGTKIGTAVTEKLGFYNAAPVVQQTDGAALTNNVTAGGTTDTIANFTDLTIYTNDAATIRNDIYQLARKLKIVDDALRTYGLLS